MPSRRVKRSRVKRVAIFRGRYKGPIRCYEGGNIAYVQNREWRCIVPYVKGLSGKTVILLAEVVQ